MIRIRSCAVQSPREESNLSNVDSTGRDPFYTILNYKALALGRIPEKTASLLSYRNAVFLILYLPLFSAKLSGNSLSAVHNHNHDHTQRQRRKHRPYQRMGGISGLNRSIRGLICIRTRRILCITYVARIFRFRLISRFCRVSRSYGNRLVFRFQRDNLIFLQRFPDIFNIYLHTIVTSASCSPSPLTFTVIFPGFCNARIASRAYPFQTFLFPVP